MADSSPPGLAPLLFGMALYVVIGIPLVYLVWEALNQLLAGYFEPVSLGLGALGLLILLGLFRLMIRAIARWNA